METNLYVQADFDVNAAFGTFVCTDQNDDWLNIYVNDDMEQDCLCDTLEMKPLPRRRHRGELELIRRTQRRRKFCPEDGSILSAADRHEPARVRTAAS